MAERKSLYLIDGHAMVYRAHYAFINRPLMNSKGQNVSAINGFVRSIWEIMRNQQPTHLGVIFDPHGGTFRSEMYAEYKAQRDAQPEDITFALPYIIDIMGGMNIPVEIIDNFEADDVIGTLAKQAGRMGFDVYIVSPDKDMAQLVDENIFQYKPAIFGNGIDILGVEEVLKKWNIQRIDQVIDILGLMGDKVDNIPGLPGVGVKTAEKLIAEFDTVEGVIANAANIKGKVGETVANLGHQAILSKQLATISLEAPIRFESNHYLIKEIDPQVLTPIFKELEFRSLAATILSSATVQGKPKTIERAEQQSLFPDETQVDTAISVLSVAENDIHSVEHHYYVVDDEQNWQLLLGRLDTGQAFCFDTETTSLDPLTAELVGISFAFVAHEAFYIPVPGDVRQRTVILDRLRSYFEDDSKAKIGQNLKYDISVLRTHGIMVAGKLWDTMLMHYLLEPDLRHNMDYLAESYLKYSPVSIKSLIGEKAKDQISMRDVPIDKVAEYAAEDADVTLQLYNYFLPKIEEIDALALYENLEARLVFVLEEMERNGVKIDTTYLNEYSKVLAGKIIALEEKIHSEAGTNFNISSPAQVGEILFQVMKIPYRWTKTKGGKYSTDEEKLSEIALNYPIAADILEHRSLSKLKSTYVDSLPQMVNKSTGRVHSSFNQALAATGRLSSNNPNLQNIPIKTEEGREIRKAFIPSDENHVLLAADYSQIELRLVAEISNETAMLDAFAHGVDIHTATAAKVYGVRVEEVSKDQRRNAKTVNFSIIYGAGALNLSRQLGISRVEASELIQQYFVQFSGLKNYMDKTVHEAREKGYVTTMMGRRRVLRDINSRNQLARTGAERIAINSPIQGTAADMIKMAMINIYAEMKKLQLKSKLILQVHDELVFDVPIVELDTLKGLVIKEMKNAIPGLKVPIEVGVDVGKNWLEAH